MSHHEAPRRTVTAGPAHQGTASVASMSSSTTALTAAVALAATAASVEGLAELIAATGATTTPMAWGIGSVIDLAVIVLALQARDAVTSGRGGHLEITLTWTASAASGTASASWQLAHAGAQAAIIRLTLPLLAAALWHLGLVGQRAATDARPARHQTRTSRLMLNLALAQSDTTDTVRARRHEQRTQRALLRHMAVASPAAQDHDLTWWRALVTSTAIPDNHPPTGPDDSTATSDTTNDAAPIPVPIAINDTTSTVPEQQDTRNNPTDPPTTPARRPSTRRLIADALHDHPDATNTQLHTLLNGVVSIRTIQRHRATLNAHSQPVQKEQQ